MAEDWPEPREPPVPEGIIPEEVIARTEWRWLIVMMGALVLMMAIIVATGIAGALHPPSNVETVDPTTLHLSGEFVETNLGSAVESDGSVTTRLIAQQYSFVPNCVLVPANASVKFRLASADVIHGFLLPGTNVNTMVVPGFVAEVRTAFMRPGDYVMPCHEFCGAGHQGMWAHVSAVPKDEFPKLTPLERTSCAR